MELMESLLKAAAAISSTPAMKSVEQEDFNGGALHRIHSPHRETWPQRSTLAHDGDGWALKEDGWSPAGACRKVRPLLGCL